MKKLSLLIALALLVTVGGVYATWNYAQGTASYREKYLTAHLTDKVTDTAKGVIEVNIDGLSLTIDDANNDHHGELIIAGEIVITFTPNEGADQDVDRDGIALQYQLGTTADYNYNGNPIFTVNTAIQTLNEGAATKSITIPASELQGLITLTDVELPDVDAYSAFKTALHSGSIQITVSEVATPVTPVG